MTSILVTGATGKLGAPTVELLRAVGHEVRALSRRAGPGLASGDLLTGRGIAGATSGVDTVIHLATTLSGKDVNATRELLRHSGGIRHLIVISIVGVDRIPLGYYKGKVEIERMVAASGIPHTILRATQFHDFIAGIFAAQRWVPVLFTPAFSFQPIDVRDVAARLTELVDGPPQGRVADIGGPGVRTARDLALAWKRATGSRKAIVPLRLPGKTFAGYAAGYNTVPGPAFGTRDFEEFLTGRYGA